MNNAQQPAFASVSEETYQSDGLTKLEYFAGLAMQGLLANGFCRHTQNWHEVVPSFSIMFAKELLKQLEDENNKG